MKLTKRILAVVLAVGMLLCCLVANAFAAERPELPTATVTGIQKDDLTFAMNFKADDVSAAQMDYYGNWYADFELTVNKKVTFDANGGADGYLAGQYDGSWVDENSSWNGEWVYVPFEPVTLEANETLRIMAFAAEMMGESGLKYTYKEVAEVVKNFSCGAFFTPEYLLANPDLVVTLELKMYNPADESQSFVIGETYTFRNSFVAYNVQTNKQYVKVYDALMAATAGQTVRLMKNVTDSMLPVFDGVTLDLNGYELTTGYLFSTGDVVDNSASNSGKLIAGQLMLQKGNRQLPVKDASGAVKFYEVVKVQHAIAKQTETSITYAFQTKFETAAHEALLAGMNTTGVKILVRATWTRPDGTTGLQEFVYNDNWVATFINSYSNGKYGKMFTLELNNYKNYENFQYQAYVISEYNPSFTIDKTTTQEVNLTNDKGATAVVPSGATLSSNTSTSDLALKVTNLEKSNSNITLQKGEEQKSVDVHVEGISTSNTVPVIVTVKKMAEAGLNNGNLKLYHVENGKTNAMTQVATLEEVDKHNEFYYDPATGDVTMALATFSEVALVSETDKAWEGNYVYDWYTKNPDAEVFEIANADQLAAFGKIVGGMAEGIERNSFEGKTVKLLSDINLADGENWANIKELENSNNNISKIFHPIGYYYTEDKNGDGTTGDYYSTVYSFKGTFDGNGHTISNFYHNTWEIKGDYDGNYYDVAMGLFGYVVNGTVKNLTVDNFSSDGEFTPTGVIAAYAENSDFINIAVTDCNPRVYNTGNGGIIGVAGSTGDKTQKIILRNITVDNSNKITALWGSWDVACGGLVGMFRGNDTGGTIEFDNCHVAAQIDVFNDVCANYQYYAYRYSGMFIGSVRTNVTNEQGQTVPNTIGITTKNCTVEFDDWNDYYYCELVANSLASYTHDHQFSRLTRVQAVNGTTIIGLDGKEFKVPASGRYNYVVVDGEHATGNATCYHFVDGEVWNHADAGTETVNGQTVLKENNAHVYLPFNQLFTGYGWGVNSAGINEYKGITVTDENPKGSNVKFDKANTAEDTYATGTTVDIGDLFAANVTGALDKVMLGGIDKNTVKVFVSPVGSDSTAGGTFVADADDWTNGTLTFTGVGAATITITDYNFCVPTVINVVIGKAIPEFEKPTNITANYGEKLSDVELPDNFTWKDSTQSVGNAGAKTFTAIFTPDNTDKYVSVEFELEVVVNKIDPTYTLPTGLTAKYGQTLADVTLEGGFAWKDSSLSVGNVGTNKFDAIFTPADTTNYNSVDVTIEVTVTREPVVKFAHKFPNTANYLYRVGNVGNVSVGTLFKLADGITDAMVDNDNLTVAIQAVDGTAASGTYTKGSAWNNGTIKFNGTGVVKVTITDKNYCTTTELLLEVVDAENATGATSATSKNIVLLNDTTATSLDISNGWTFYGNQFTITFNGDGSYRSAALSYGFVTIENGTLDSAQIKCRIFPKSYLYTNKMEAGSDGRYPYGYSAIVVNGNSVISNSYIYGARNNITIGDGNVLIKNTITKCASVANIHIKGNGGSTVTLDDVTTIQYLVGDDFGVGNKVIGFGVLVGDIDSTSYPTINIKGDFNQYNWVTQDDFDGVTDGYVQAAIKGSLAATDYKHTNINGENTVNMGIAFLTTNVSVNINNTSALASKYKLGTISISGYTGRVYSLASGSGVDPKDGSDVAVVLPDNNEIIPTVQYNSGNSSVTLTTGYDSTVNKHINRLTVDLDNISGGTYSFKFADIKLTKYGKELSFTVRDANGNTVDKNTTITLNALATNNYTFVVTDNIIYDQNGNKTGASYTVELEFILYATKTSIEPPKFEGIGTGGAIRLEATKGGDWRPAYEALTGVSVTYWSSTERKVKTVELSTLYDKGTINSNVWTYTCADFTITLTGGAVHSDGTKIAPIVSNDTLYFASTNKAFGTGTTSRNVIITYVFTDNNASCTESMTKKVNYNDLTAYNYEKFQDGELSTEWGSITPCVTPDTLITLADGTQKRIDEVTYNDQLLVWNHFTGSYDVAPAAIIFNHGYANNTIIKLSFSDGTIVKVTNLHQFYDTDLNEYVSIDAESVAQYVGHGFAKQYGDGFTTVTLDSYEVSVEYEGAYGIISAFHYNIIVEGMISTDFMIEDYDLFNYFELGENMTFDVVQMQADIEKYGLYTYEDFADYLTYEQFVGFNVQYFKIAVGKGNYTYEGILELINTYLN